MELFAFRLAKELGEVDVDKMLESISLDLFYRWMEYFAVEPFGEERADVRAAVVAHRACCIMANVYRTEHSVRILLDDFMPKFGSRARSSRRQSVGEMKTRLHTFAQAHNEAIKRKG